VSCQSKGYEQEVDVGTIHISWILLILALVLNQGTNKNLKSTQ